MIEFETITGFLRQLTLVDEYSLTILMIMVGWSVLLIHLAVESRMYAAFFVPGMFVGGLIAFRLARLTGFQIVAYKDANAIIRCGGVCSHPVPLCDHCGVARHRHRHCHSPWSTNAAQ